MKVVTYPKYLLSTQEFIQWVKLNEECLDEPLELLSHYSNIMNQPFFLSMFVPVSNTGAYLKNEWKGQFLPKDAKVRSQIEKDIKYYTQQNSKKWFEGFDVVNKTSLYGVKYISNNMKQFFHGYVTENRTLVAPEHETLEQMVLLKDVDRIECTLYFWEHIVFELH